MRFNGEVNSRGPGENPKAEGRNPKEGRKRLDATRASERQSVGKPAGYRPSMEAMKRAYQASKSLPAKIQTADAIAM